MIGVINVYKTVKQAIDEMPERITTIRILNYQGTWLGTFSRNDAIDKYGYYSYSAGYSEGFNEVSMWIRKTIQNNYNKGEI